MTQNDSTPRFRKSWVDTVLGGRATVVVEVVVVVGGGREGGRG